MSSQKKKRQEEWARAKKLCRLNVRQVEMARELGLNPAKLPRLIPNRDEPWKLPVGEYIEELHLKRFGARRQSAPAAAQPFPAAQESDREAAEIFRGQAQDLVCHFSNLSDDLEDWLVAGGPPLDLVPELVDDLMNIVEALAHQGSISQLPHIPLVPERERTVSHPLDETASEADEEVPF